LRHFSFDDFDTRTGALFFSARLALFVKIVMSSWLQFEIGMSDRFAAGKCPVLTKSKDRIGVENSFPRHTRL
jgi:hypothetical protein